MLVEDDNNLREIYEARLQAESYTIVSARDGEEALVIAKAEKPDLIIADVMMPKISGFEMLDILRNTDGLKEVKVIMLTALGQNDDQKRATELGADRYLVKSQVTLEDIVKVAHELLNDAPVETPATNPEPPIAPEPSTNPAPAPEPTPPVATPAPAPEPIAEPTPADVAPTPQPASQQPPSNAQTADNEAESTTKEENEVETRIEDFVAGASEDPSTPEAPVVDTAQASTTSPEETPADPAQQQANTETDDKLMAEAVDTLVADTEDAKVKQEPVPPSVDKPAVPASETSETGSVPIARKIVIQPPAADPKKDMDALLAIETANEAKGASVAPPQPVIGTADGAVQGAPIQDTASDTQPPATPTVDPHSIAL